MDPQRALGAARLPATLLQQGFQPSDHPAQVPHLALQEVDLLLDQFLHLHALHDLRRLQQQGDFVERKAPGLRLLDETNPFDDIVGIVPMGPQRR